MKQPTPLPIDYLECARMDIHGNSVARDGTLFVRLDDVDAVIDTLKAERSRSHPILSSQPTEDTIPFSDWLSINNAKVRNATLDKLQSKFLDAMNERSFTDSDGDYFQCSQLSKDEIDMVIKSLRTEEQP
jgi:hypothetical protein